MSDYDCQEEWDKICNALENLGTRFDGTALVSLEMLDWLRRKQAKSIAAQGDSVANAWKTAELLESVKDTLRPWWTDYSGNWDGSLIGFPLIVEGIAGRFRDRDAERTKLVNVCRFLVSICIDLGHRIRMSNHPEAWDAVLVAKSILDDIEGANTDD